MNSTFIKPFINNAKFFFLPNLIEYVYIFKFVLLVAISYLNSSKYVLRLFSSSFFIYNVHIQNFLVTFTHMQY